MRNVSDNHVVERPAPPGLLRPRTPAAVPWQADFESGDFTHVGAQAIDLLGYPLEQWYESNFWAAHIHPDDRDEAVTACLALSRTASQFELEYRMVAASGKIVWIYDLVTCEREDGRPVRLRGFLLDITERKLAEQELEKERVFLRQVIDVNPNFVFAKDRNGRFTLVNQAFADAHGTTVEAMIGKTDWEVNPNHEDVSFFRRVDAEVLDTQQERFIPEERLTDAHGQVRWLQTVKRPILDSNGAASQVLCSATDVTRRKETESELQLQRQQLAHVTRISTMGELAASLAHELNQPLAVILASAEAARRLLDAGPQNVPQVQEILADIVQANNRASEVIRRMRALLVKGELEFALLDMDSVIRDVVVLTHSDAILNRVRVSLELDEGLPRVRGDRVHLQQVVLNIMLNAFDAMAMSAGERSLVVGAKYRGSDIVQVAVRDTGIGFAPDHADRIFEAFYTTKRDGLGMGLSISRSIIKAHGGDLWAENHPDGGTTFFFTVPSYDHDFVTP